MISMIMVLNQKGDIMISRQYRQVSIIFLIFFSAMHQELSFISKETLTPRWKPKIWFYLMSEAHGSFRISTDWHNFTFCCQCQYYRLRLCQAFLFFSKRLPKRLLFVTFDLFFFMWTNELFWILTFLKPVFIHNRDDVSRAAADSFRLQVCVRQFCCSSKNVNGIIICL